MSQPSVAAGSCSRPFAEAKDTPIALNEKELPQALKQQEPDISKSSSSQQQQQLQPYTTHSFILPASITSVHSNATAAGSSTAATAAANVGVVSSLPAGPAPAPLQPLLQQQQPQHPSRAAAPIAIAPFHGVIQHHHHPIMVTATGPSPATTHPAVGTGAGAALVPTIFMAPTPASFLIPHHHHHPMPAIGGSSDQRHHCPSNKLRSGKWLPEEEEYAMLLVQLFEQGLLTDLEKGTTLRSFLARRLHCAPMRISKKFAGRGIGKMSYTQNNAALVLQAQQQQQRHPPQPMILQKLQQTEDNFHRAIFPSTAPRFSSPIQVHERRRSSTVRLLLSLPVCVWCVCCFLRCVLHSHLQQPMVPMTSLMAPAQLAAAATAGVLPPFAQLPTTVVNVATAKQQQQQQPMTMGSQGQTMVAAAPQQQAFHPFQLGGNPLHTILQQQQQLSVPKATNNNTTSAAPATTPRSAPSSTVVAVAPQTTTTTTLALPSSTTVAPPAATSVLPEPPSEPTLTSSVDTTHDLLSGFDKVMQQQTKQQQLTTSSAALTTATSIVLEDEEVPPHSPPFTSRSFDDFHRFLGKDLTLLEEAAEDTTTKTTTTSSSSAPLFVEESYRMLRMDEAPAFRLTAAPAPTNELDAIDDVLNAVSSEPSLLLQQPYDDHHRLLSSPSSSTAAALVSEDGTNSSDSDTSAEGPVRKKTKTA